MELDTIESIKASVIANHGVAIIPYTSVKTEIHAKILKTLPISGFSPSCNICMIYRKNKAFKPHIRELYLILKLMEEKLFVSQALLWLFPIYHLLLELLPYI